MFAYSASLPQPQRGVAERIDALAAKTLPDLQRAVRWGMAYYGVGAQLRCDLAHRAVALAALFGDGLVDEPDGSLP